MSEKLKRRIKMIEQKIIPPKPRFDLIAEVARISLEKQRLLSLPIQEFNLELAQPPKTMIEKTARESASNQKRFDSLTPQEKQREAGYINLTEEEILKLQATQTLAKARCWSWLQNHLAKSQSRKP